MSVVIRSTCADLMPVLCNFSCSIGNTEFYVVSFPFASLAIWLKMDTGVDVTGVLI